MKRIAILLALSLSASFVLAQAQKPAATTQPEPAKPAAQAPAKPAAQESAKTAKTAKRAAKPGAMAKKSRRSEDARACLEKGSNDEIIKCAEEYL
jgi:hypothetical protein